MICRSFVFLCLGVLVGNSAYAASLLVDINDRAGAQPTQSGYIGITQNGVAGLATALGVLDISFTGVTGIALDDRDRGALDASQPLSDLLRDIVYISENFTTGSGDGVLDLTIAGLAAGEYSFKGYFHDRNVDHVSGDIAVSTDGGGTFAQVIDDGLYSSGTNPAVIGISTFTFHANGVDAVVVRMTGQGGLYSLSSGAFTDQDTALLAGFEVTSIPEPSAVVLAVFGVTATGWMQRRR